MWLYGLQKQSTFALGLSLNHWGIMKQDQLNSIEPEERNVFEALGNRGEYSFPGLVIVVLLIGLELFIEWGNNSWGTVLVNIALLAYLLHYGAMRAYGVGGQRWSRVLRYVILLVFLIGVGKIRIDSYIG